jgi:hypothetical protein
MCLLREEYKKRKRPGQGEKWGKDEGEWWGSIGENDVVW